MNIDETKSHLAAIVQSSDDAIVSKTLDGTIVSWNPAAERIFGYSAAEAIGQNISLIIPADRMDEEFVIIGKVRAGQVTDHFETIRRRKDGEMVELSITVSPILDDKGTVIGASKIAREIGTLKQAEKASAYLAAIVDSSDDAIISKNLDGIITTWNAGAERLLGYTAAEAIGRHISLIIPADKMDEEYAIIGKVKTGQRINHFETVRRRKDGGLVDISITVSPILDSKGKIVGASKIARDVSEQKRTHQALRDLSRRKDDFIANVSHELRTPMNAVIGLSEILSMSGSLTEKERKYVATLRQSADSLMLLIDNLLDFSKAEAQSLELEQVEFSLPKIAESTLALIEIKAREKGLRIGISYTPPLRKYYIGDPVKIQQVLSNLLSNAVKFTAQGSVSLSFSGRDEAGRTLLTMEVADTGIGIPQKKQEAIFEKFTQADASTTRQFGGTGLGLSICRAYVEKMGGTIAVRSREGMGSAFTVTIPLQHSPQQTMIEAGPNGRKHHRKNVLVVDDYEPNVIVVTALLDRLGYNYDVADNGLDAVRSIQAGSYDVILMDVQMPGMDGFESTRRIRDYETENNAEATPIVAMTAHVMERDKHKCMEAGMNAFIPKPFSSTLLEDVLARFVKAPAKPA